VFLCCLFFDLGVFCCFLLYFVVFLVSVGSVEGCVRPAASEGLVYVESMMVWLVCLRLRILKGL
jgi:hypothetical protein